MATRETHMRISQALLSHNQALYDELVQLLSRTQLKETIVPHLLRVFTFPDRTGTFFYRSPLLEKPLFVHSISDRAIFEKEVLRTAADEDDVRGIVVETVRLGLPTHQVDVQTEYDGLFHQRRTVKIDNEVASDPCHQVPAVFGSLLGPNATWESTVGLGKVIGVVF